VNSQHILLSVLEGAKSWWETRDKIMENVESAGHLSERMYLLEGSIYTNFIPLRKHFLETKHYYVI